MRITNRITALILAALMSAGALQTAALATPVTSAAPSTSAKPIEIGYQTYTEADHGLTVSTETEDADLPDPLPEPVVIKFGSMPELFSNGRLQDAPKNEEGSYNFVKAPDGTPCLRLNYSIPEQGNWSPYRCMPGFGKKDQLTEYHKYLRITYMTEDPLGAELTLTNNGTGSKLTVLESSHISDGEWITTNAVNFSSTDFLTRLNNGQHLTVQFKSSNTDTCYYLKEIAFFCSEKQAYDYYGDGKTLQGITKSEMRFGDDAAGSTNNGDTYGVHSVSEEGDLDITYAEKTNIGGMHYMAKIKFKNTKAYNQNHVFIRILYAADMPENIPSPMYLRNDGNSECIRLTDSIVDTNGEYVLTPTTVIAKTFPERYAKGNHTSLMIGYPGDGATFSIKAIYFFPDRASANAFEVVTGATDVTVNGNDISKYQIVTAENASPKITESANAIYKHILELTGAVLPVVTDAAPKSEYEILVGRSSRELSNKLVDELGNFNSYVVDIDGNTIVLSAYLQGLTSDAVNTFLDSFLFRGKSVVPEDIALDDSVTLTAKATTIKEVSNWNSVTNVSDPIHYTDDFDADDGYWQEENNAQSFSFKSGKLVSAKTAERALTYLHIYEKNAVTTAVLSYKSAGKAADFGIMQRYQSDEAWVKAGYDFEKGEWYIDSREGIDFVLVRAGSKAMTLTEGKEYKVTLKTDGTSAKLYVDGTKIIDTTVSHVTPGRVAIFAKDVILTADNFDLEMTSAQGTLMKDTVHWKLPTDKYLEGGTVIVMSDGSLTYRHGGGTTYVSKDNGLTWTETAKWSDITGYPNVLRLNNGELIKTATSGGYYYTYTSGDDGKTWTQGGLITKQTFTGTDGKTAGGGNMNDKLFQSGTNDRIYYSLNYEGSARPDGRQVFCEFFYSDDNGKTWTKSETSSWTIEGNDNQVYFGECKMLECADGTIRMYNSWNDYGCIVYSESTDGGKTFGPLVKMSEFVCARSSMQFVRDPYADNDTTYYMVWVYSEPISEGSPMARSRLSLAKSTDGKSWEYLGDLWRWESNYTVSGAHVNHIVDPFVQVTEDYVIVGTGLSEQMASGYDYPYHQGQRQHIWSIKKDSLPEGKIVNIFEDVSEGASYNNAISFVASEGLFNGVSATTFAPETTMNRAMFVTVLGRLDKADVSKYTTPTFDDVEAGQWYTSYVEWAAANGIVNGMGGGKYGVTGEVTVEQACTILYRYADGKTAAEKSGKTVDNFADSAKISSWASDAVKWAVENGIYEGTLGGALTPNAPATRAVVATMFYNYVNNIK